MFSISTLLIPTLSLKLCFQLHYRRNRTFFSGLCQHQSTHGIEPHLPPGFHRNRTGYTNTVHVKTELTVSISIIGLDLREILNFQRAWNFHSLYFDIILILSVCQPVNFNLFNQGLSGFRT
jgi:hypothetical protein